MKFGSFLTCLRLIEALLKNPSLPNPFRVSKMAKKKKKIP